MHYSTLDYLNVVAAYLPARLVSPQTVARVSELAAALPPSSNFGFECKLGSQAPDADFLVAVIAADGSRGAWAGENPLALPAVPLFHPIWRKVQEVLADWHRGGDGLEPIHDSWLEFDIQAGGPVLPVPSFFFGFDDAAACSHPRLAEALIERLLGRPLSSGKRLKLRACYAALPPRAVIFEVGVMLARTSDAVRLCIRGLMPEQIVTYLQEICWPGSSQELCRQIEGLEPLADAISLDLTVDETVQSQIGLECSIYDGPAGRARLQALLEYLSKTGACLPEKREALLSWLGYCTEQSDRLQWPAHLLKASVAFGKEVLSTFARTVNHLKIGYQSGDLITAKAYLGVRHFWAAAVSQEPGHDGIGTPALLSATRARRGKQ
ncbi:MAG TPA: hypothetical protein VOA80_12830 [Thermoanaerobaculia bacterium]|nr:hypothetical protein [Thermoanaerobaculia bacterium]